ncbi:hypothetical protein EK21DRAFT_85466 [Setomelanomma holmii]|uniref:Uncharacterized protein n=1 Tax=Setomelanomma holmii TaxID=210430 RepID=A0A9P4HIZ1_9PLEO|nr:hypothetical protein EK21DRAFT_85466 [Setomelanomma holmii]
MARRFCLKDSEGADIHPSNFPNSISGTAVPYSECKKAHESWQPDLPGNTRVLKEHNGDIHNALLTGKEVATCFSLYQSTSSVSPPISQCNLPYDEAEPGSVTPPCSQSTVDYGRGVEAKKSTPTPIGPIRDKDPIPKHTSIEDRYLELFGKLPDPIILQEQLGDFDGQVVFIGHPNRDITAHQWSASSFQWENIGRYAHFRREAEGALASDILNAPDTSCDALTSFKNAAKIRERVVCALCSTEEKAHGILEQAQTRSAIPTADSTDLGPSKEVQSHAVPRQRFAAPSAQVFNQKTKSTKRHHYDDPFVVQAAHPRSELCLPSSRIHDASDAIGSLDFKYEFPVRAHTSRLLQSTRDVTIATTFGGLVTKDPDTSYQLHCQSHPVRAMIQSGLHKYKFDGDTSEMFTHSAMVNSRPRGTIIPAVLDSFDTSTGITDEIHDPPAHVGCLGANLRKLTTASSFLDLRQAAQSLFRQPGLTIANPHGSTHRSDLVTASIRPLTETRKVSQFETTTVGGDFLAPLHFSDPDSARRAPSPEIANGLSQQPPTVQNLKGPFFTASKPTAHDPTVLLAVYIDEEEKLCQWFRDGHRLARQREYARTLTAAASTGPAGDKPKGSNVLDDTPNAARYGHTDVTTPFVRLFESLSEYIEEHRNGSGSSYFTRSWKPASPCLRDLSPTGNNSYFSSSVPSTSNIHQHLVFETSYQQRCADNTGGGMSTKGPMQLHRPIDVARGPVYQRVEPLAMRTGTHRST